MNHTVQVPPDDTRESFSGGGHIKAEKNETGRGRKTTKVAVEVGG